MPNIQTNSIVNDIAPLNQIIGAIQFNNYNLTSLCSGNTGIAIKTGNTLSLDNINIESYVNKIIDGGVIIDKTYGIKEVTFTAFIQAETDEGLIELVQELHKELNNKNGKLYVKLGGVTHYYEATCNNIDIPTYNVTEHFIDKISITFLITSPHSYLLEPIATIFSKTEDFTKVITNTGNYETYPIITIIGKTGCNITNIDLTLEQIGGSNAETVTLTDNIVEGSVLKLDYSTPVMIFNGNETTFTGFVNPLEVGNNLFSFDFTGTVNVEVVILYNKTYI